MVRSPRAGHGAVEITGRRPVAFAHSLDLSSDAFCEIISTTSKNIRRARTQLDEIFPTQLEPRIDLLELEQNDLRHALPRRIEGAAYFRLMPAPHPRDLALTQLMEMDELQHEDRIFILFSEGALNRVAQ